MIIPYTFIIMNLEAFLFLCLSVFSHQNECVTEPHYAYVGEGCTVSVIVSAVNVMHSCSVSEGGGPMVGGLD